ncbi:cupin domain-containing protein [Neorhizobium alkalisoli]|uniref:(S)-ureidoglycine aminohydrolase cupin domain-containing protein n=1 Tax=Neorhizobium alkalisoli TaxID=528178 RepID=A0A561QRK4_9HYPH|nr:cupin domain-containing protein [Neorhizobium alkalisoli]TWF53028.1 hypothetical protein FHW37_104299 [Neorhizobium alkalisoli]
MALHVIVAVAAALGVRYKAGMPARAPVISFVAAEPQSLELKPAPINPEWILSGTPQARAGLHSNAPDNCASTCVWDCTAGAFRWYFGWDETVVILEGEVSVTTECGMNRVLQAGDIAYFKGGTWATWNVGSYVRKIAFVRRPFPTPLAYLYRLGGFLSRHLKFRQLGGPLA